MKERIDKLIVNRGLLETRRKAQSYILAGNIYVDGVKVTKASKIISTDSKIEIVLPNQGYVSRGGIKLKHAITQFKIGISGKRCMDLGSSTGGFTDCLLKEGASFVTAVDVGKGLLHNSLINNSKVRSYEGYNARYIDNLDIGYVPDVVTIDVSFISIKLILKPLLKIIDKNTRVISLIKPQFELRKRFKGFKGVIRDRDLHKAILLELHEYFTSIGFKSLGYTYSPIKGPKGNIEYFASLMKEEDRDKLVENNRLYDESYFNHLIENSHRDLD